MQLLWIATKSPWPPRDGGRLLLRETLAALADDHEIALVAPEAERAARAAARLDAGSPARDRTRRVLVPARRRARLASLARSLAGGDPFALARHRSGAVRAAVERELAHGRFDAVVVEQLQAWPQSEPARRAGLPVVLRAQNVESDLWRALAPLRRGAAGRLAGREARRLARAEGEAVAAADWTIALTAADARRLAELGGGRGRVERLAPPFPPRLETAARALPGAPAIVLLASAGWAPNADGERWFLESVWPAIHARSPEARLHLFGSTGERHPAPGLVGHPRPGESAEAFAPGALLVVPLRVPIGLRMRILEAWARGVAVISTPEGAEGLDATDGRELLLARDGGDFAQAVERLAGSPELSRRLIEAGRARLAEAHAPERFARDFAAGLARLVGARR